MARWRFGRREEMRGEGKGGSMGEEGRGRLRRRNEDFLIYFSDSFSLHLWEALVFRISELFDRFFSFQTAR